MDLNSWHSMNEATVLTLSPLCPDPHSTKRLKSFEGNLLNWKKVFKGESTLPIFKGNHESSFWNTLQRICVIFGPIFTSGPKIRTHDSLEAWVERTLPQCYVVLQSLFLQLFLKSIELSQFKSTFVNVENFLPPHMPTEVVKLKWKRCREKKKTHRASLQRTLFNEKSKLFFEPRVQVGVWKIN